MNKVTNTYKASLLEKKVAMLPNLIPEDYVFPRSSVPEKEAFDRPDIFTTEFISKNLEQASLVLNHCFYKIAALEAKLNK